MKKDLIKFNGIAVVSAWMFHLSINVVLAAPNAATIEVLGGGGGGGGGGAGESGAGGNASGVTGGTAGSGGGGTGGTAVSGAAGGGGTAGTPATYQIVGGGGGAGGDDTFNGGACGAPGGGSGGGEVTGAGNGCRGEVRIIYVDSEVTASGGTETTSGIYRIHTFTTSGTFTVSLIRPTVTTTDPATNISVGSATLGGNITATGGENATMRGFAFSTDSTLNTGVATTTESGSFGTGAFTRDISGLLSGTLYYFRAYASNSIGTSTGSTVSFTTTTDTTPSRKMRLFEGFRIRLIDGRLLIHQQ
ncbi:MAG: hypothetical protein HY445_01715 [Candidatus Niyogibacteria bacterium]|nr:hypothetical protein [Candidatus Niyogibacteria bacterium]